MAEQVARKLLQADIHDPGRRTATISTWLTKHGGIRVDPQTLMLELCERLIAAGVPLSGASYGAPTLHPQVWGSQFIWRRDGGGVSEVRHRHDAARSSTYRDSPVRVLHQGAAAVRRRLDIPTPQLDFPILRELADEGATDYVAMPLHFSSGKMGYISWVSDRLGGFNTSDLALLYDLLPLIALRLELEASYHVSKSLMETYLGRDAARRVLAGQIKRGRGKRIRAAILLSDLRDFTAMSDRLPANEVIVLLNDYFDIMATQVQEHGGEVLKFIGDGMLAVFNVGRSLPDAACCQSMHAAIEAVRALTALNLDRAEKLEVGIALHLGDVVYGNIGAADRLDFTVIGAAVNEAARIQGLCRSLDKQILVSAGFACGCTSKPLISVGLHHLRGVSEKQELFAVDAL
jgi:adenylate cyclase